MVRELVPLILVIPFIAHLVQPRDIMRIFVGTKYFVVVATTTATFPDHSYQIQTTCLFI
jgi:hypothetical protein